MKRFCEVLALVACLGVMPASLAAEEAAFRAGAATADITPPPGVSLNGPIAKPGPIRGVHDPLHARAIVLALGDVKVAIVVNDMCSIDREVFDQAKELVRRKLGIPATSQLVSSTHSHATPRVLRVSTAAPDEAYRRQVAEGIVKAIVAAHERLAPAAIGFGTFDEPEFVHCRRHLCKAASVGANPFGETGELVKSVSGVGGAIIRPAGPVDPSVSVLSIRHLDGRPLALLANYSVHYAGGYAGGLVSADYFGVFARCVEKEFGKGSDGGPFVAIMSNGTSGDTESAKPRTADHRAAWTQMEYVGNKLAERTIALVANFEHRSPRILTVAASELEFTYRKPTAERIAWAKKLLADPKDKGPHAWSRVYAQQTLDMAEYPDRCSLPFQAIRIGEVGIAATPCEAFAETGLAIKAGSPLKNTFTIELANGCGGYLPTPEQHTWGGYETWLARSANLEVQAEPKIRAELLRLLGEVAK